MADLDRCAELEPRSGWPHYRAALLLRARGDEDAAAARLRRALAVEGAVTVLPRDAWHDLNRCVFHLAAGDVEAGAAAARAAVGSGARPADLCAARENLEELQSATGVDPSAALAALR